MNNCENCKLTQSFAEFMQKDSALDKEYNTFQMQMLQIVKMQREQISDLQTQIDILKQMIAFKNQIAEN